MKRIVIDIGIQKIDSLIQTIINKLKKMTDMIKGLIRKEVKICVEEAVRRVMSADLDRHHRTRKECIECNENSDKLVIREVEMKANNNAD